MDYLQILTSLNLDPVVIIMVIAGGFFSKTYFEWSHIHIGRFRCNISAAWKTLIVGSVFCTIYAAIRFYNGTFTAGTNETFFYSYVSATSFYELMLKPFTAYVAKKFGGDEPKTPAQ